MSTRREFLEGAAAVGLSFLSTNLIAKYLAHANTSVGRADNSSRKSGIRIKSLVRREDTMLRYGASGDNWHMSWGSDDRQYLSLCDGAGFSSPPKPGYNTRLFTVDGGPRAPTFIDLASYPFLGRPTQKANDPRYYSLGTLALDGYIYQFLSTFNRPPDGPGSLNLDNALRFVGAKLIYSSDSGRTWHNQNGSTPVIWEDWDHRSRDTMVFFEEDQEAFSLLSILQMGRNYENNRDGYVYVYAPNGNSEGTMNELVMFRVPKLKILDRSAYEYFAGAKSGSSSKWSKSISDRRPVFTFPSGWVNKLVHPYAWQPSVTYNAPLGLYMMVNWGTGTAPNDTWFAKPSYLGFWVAHDPWGPWTQIHEETAWVPGHDKGARAYQPQFAPKWIAADGKSFWLVWSDFQGYDSEELIKWGEEYQRKSDENTLTELDLTRNAAMMRKYMPNYRFNMQKVDLFVA